MRKTIFCSLCCVVAFLVAMPAVFAYDVVLKNGKVVKGDLVSQDDTMFVLQDASGVRIQVKKSTVDLEKTESANVKPPELAAPKEETTAGPATKTAAPQKPHTKKPARRYTAADLERLREEHHLNEGTFPEPAAEGTEEASAEKPVDQAEAAKKAEDTQKKAEALRKRIEQAQQAYDTLSQQCALLKTKNFQTDRIYDEKGNPLPFYDTIKKVCDDADKAKAIIDEANQELSTLQ